MSKSQKRRRPIFSHDGFSINVSFTKGVITGSRGVCVEVVEVKSGRSLKARSVGKTKSSVRAEAERLVSEMITELSSS